MPKSKRRSKASKPRAIETQVAQQKAEVKKLTPEQYMRRRVVGWGLVVLGVLVGVTHWVAHLGVLYDTKGIWDLAAGYPMAGALGVAGAVVLSK